MLHQLSLTIVHNIYYLHSSSSVFTPAPLAKEDFNSFALSLPPLSSC